MATSFQPDPSSFPPLSQNIHPQASILGKPSVASSLTHSAGPLHYNWKDLLASNNSSSKDLNLSFIAYIEDEVPFI